MMTTPPSEKLSRPGSRERSLVRQAIQGIVLAELICMVIIAAVSIVHERRARLRALDFVLEGRADSVFGAVQDAEDAGDNVRLDPREMEIPAGDFFAVYDQSGRRLGGSPGAFDSLRASRAEGPARLRDQRWGGHTYRVLWRSNLRVIDRAETKGMGLERPITIGYAMPLDHVWREVFEGIGFFLGASLVLTLGTTAYMVALMRRVLQPIEELASAASAVSPSELSFRAPEHALNTKELRPLALALTAMLAELRLAFEKQHRFLGDAAHELKTAVAVVRSSLQLLLLRTRSPEAYEEGLQAAVLDNARAEDLISRMLLMARLEEPRAGLKTIYGDLCSVVQTCLTRLQPLAENSGVRCVQSGFSPTTLLGDSGGVSATQAIVRDRVLVPVSSIDLEVLVSNLLVNAIEHSAAGSLVDAAITREQDEVVLSVRDEGEGIPEEAQRHIFERFFRVDQSRTRVTGGAGLGLAITKAIVDAGGGSIAVLSRVGEGTTIIVRLPLASPEETFGNDIE